MDYFYGSQLQIQIGGPKLAVFSSSFKPDNSRLAETGNNVTLPSK